MDQPGKSLVAIVDDENAVREALASLLRSTGLPVASFTSAEEFLHSSSHDDIGCLILDINLPAMSGLHLQQLLASKGSHIRIILITAQEDRAGRIQAQVTLAGAHALLFKPFLDEDLLGAVQSALMR